jgi:hypothetical protein
MNRATICLILGLVLGSFLVSCIDAQKVIHMPLHRKPKIREYISRVVAKHPHLPENVNVLAVSRTSIQLYLYIQRMRNLESNPFELFRLVEIQTVPLDGSENKLGEYYVNFTLGTPGQKFTTQCKLSSSRF